MMTDDEFELSIFCWWRPGCSGAAPNSPIWRPSWKMAETPHTAAAVRLQCFFCLFFLRYDKWKMLTRGVAMTKMKKVGGRRRSLKVNQEDEDETNGGIHAGSWLAAEVKVRGLGKAAKP